MDRKANSRAGRDLRRRTGDTRRSNHKRLLPSKSNHSLGHVGKLLHHTEQKSYKRQFQTVALLTAMTTARSLIVQPGQIGHFHCTVRCVQQLFLCGNDRRTGECHGHRREWIERRIFQLADLFAVSIHSFAVMSNHLHVVITVDPGHVARWDNWEVAQRGVRLYARAGETEDDQHARALPWRDNPDQIEKLRLRLGSLSDFMKALNEYIARAANKESGRKGHFWDKRYGCVALLDDAALLAAMVYVDLNPVRAGMASNLLRSDHTSVQRRLRNVRADRRSATQPLTPIAGIKQAQVDMTNSAYIELVDVSGRQLHPNKHGRIPPTAPAVLKQIGLNEPQWLVQVRGIESRYCRAVGGVDALLCLALRLGQRWVRGIVGANALERMR